jgi:hypothetical protein
MRAGYWQLQLPAPVTSERRAALDWVAELEFEWGAVCDWFVGGGWLDPEGVELEGGVELVWLICSVVPVESDAPVVDPGRVLWDGDGAGDVELGTRASW